MDMNVIYTEDRKCTSCMEEHKVKTVQVKEHTIFKNVQVDYIAEYYYCDYAEECYMDEKMMTDNDIRMKDAYRKSVGLLTSNEICDIRVKYGVTQSDLCTLLGWGGKTITRYEGCQVQDKAHDTILRKLEQDPEWFLHLLIEKNENFPQKTYERYLEIARLLYEKNQDNYLRKAIEAKYACFQSNRIYNGNTQLSLDKVVDVIRYFSNSPYMKHLYKVKLMKLLWYADALSYKQRGYAMTGLVYQALPMGAVPIAHDSILKLRGVEYEEIDMGDGTAYYFRSSSKDEDSNLSEEDKSILDSIIQKFGTMTKDEIVSFMHREEAYRETAVRDMISFQYAENLLIE